MSEKKPLKTKMVVAKSFKVYISRCINLDFKESDLERGYTKIVSKTLGNYIYYKRPPKDLIVKAVVKKRDMEFLEDKYKEILPDLVYFV